MVTEGKTSSEFMMVKNLPAMLRKTISEAEQCLGTKNLKDIFFILSMRIA